MAERQPGINAGRLLADHAGAQHQAVRDDLRLGGRLLEKRQKEAGQAHVRVSPFFKESSDQVLLRNRRDESN